jgi:putative GTP pyrophosphokinase
MAEGGRNGGWLVRRAALRARYDELHEPLRAVTADLVSRIERLLSEAKLRATVKGRVKSFDAFLQKLVERDHGATVEDPFGFLTDTIGLRLVTPFQEDLDRAQALLRGPFRLEEVDDKSRNLSHREFGYDATHLLLVVPDDVLESHGRPPVRVAEVQLRTTLMDAWAEVEHELVYKADLDVDQTVRRRLSALNATLQLADTIFQELRDHQRQRYADLQRPTRRRGPSRRARPPPTSTSSRRAPTRPSRASSSGPSRPTRTLASTRRSPSTPRSSPSGRPPPSGTTAASRGSPSATTSAPPRTSPRPSSSPPGTSGAS